MDFSPAFLPPFSGAFSVCASAPVHCIQVHGYVFFLSGRAEHELLYLISLGCFHTISPFCAPQIVSLAHFDLAVSQLRPPLVFFLSLRLRLLVYPLFPPHKLVSASTMCAGHFALLLFGGSACELTKKTVRSMIIASRYLWELVRP